MRDRRDLLARTLDALASQTVSDHEVIVVDDGSRDGSFEEATERARVDQRVRVVASGGAGAVAARSLGVRASTAPVLAFTDSDCLPAPTWLAAGLAAIDAGADVVQGLTRPPRPVRPLERTVWSLKDDGLFATCNVFYRRAAFDAAGGFDPDAGGRLGFRPGSRLRALGFGEDALLGWRVRRTGHAAFAPDAVVHHEVLPPDARDALRRAWTIGAFPALFREIPELRRLLGGEFAAGRRDRIPLYAAAGALVFRQPALAAALAGVWIARRWTTISRTEPSTRRRMKVLPIDLAVEATKAAALLWGSARARQLIL